MQIPLGSIVPREQARIKSELHKTQEEPRPSSPLGQNHDVERGKHTSPLKINQAKSEMRTY